MHCQHKKKTVQVRSGNVDNVVVRIYLFLPELVKGALFVQEKKKKKLCHPGCANSTNEAANQVEAGQRPASSCARN